MNERGFARPLAILFVFLLFLLLSFSYAAYPIMKYISNFADDRGYTADANVDNVINYSLAALGAAGLIFAVGIFIWLAARMVKEEEYVWRK